MRLAAAGPRPTGHYNSTRHPFGPTIVSESYRSLSRNVWIVVMRHQTKIIERPIRDPRFADDAIYARWPKAARVSAILAVVSHHVYVTFGNLYVLADGPVTFSDRSLYIGLV